MSSAEDAIEREVRKRLAERLVSAGVDNGRVSLEILYLLPPEFVRAYVSLWDRALGPGHGVANPNSGMGEAAAASRPQRIKTGGRGTDATRDAFSRGAGGGGGGKRHREFWVVRDEGALTVKSSVDRKLLRVMREAMEQLQAMRSAGDN